MGGGDKAGAEAGLAWPGPAGARQGWSLLPYMTVTGMAPWLLPPPLNVAGVQGGLVKWGQASSVGARAHSQRLCLRPAQFGWCGGAAFLFLLHGISSQSAK